MVHVEQRVGRLVRWSGSPCNETEVKSQRGLNPCRTATSSVPGASSAFLPDLVEVFLCESQESTVRSCKLRELRKVNTAFFQIILVALSQILVCVHAAQNEIKLPPEIAMNRTAGHWGRLFVNIRVGGAEDVLFLLDTGASRTVVDKSLQRRLGKRLESGLVDDRSVSLSQHR